MAADLRDIDMLTSLPPPLMVAEIFGRGSVSMRRRSRAIGLSHETSAAIPVSRGLTDHEAD
jgi:ABC-type uncharacterized transport system YnjBCD ATPase subunit